MFYLTQNDTSPSISVTLQPAPINLIGATAVKFSMRLRGGAVKISRADMVVEDAAAGVVQYDWQTGDTDVAGQFEAEVEVTYADGSIETFPNAAPLDITIRPEIA